MVQTTRIGKLSFEDIKLSIQNYLSQQTEFTDYNFQGSGITQLINILAYNAHYDALTDNYLANETFLDTAVKRSSVTSRVKELGYVPRSRIAASTTLNISVVLSAPTNTQILIPAGTRFNTTVGDQSYTFTTITPRLMLYSSTANAFLATLNVYEGVLTQEKTFYDSLSNIFPISNTDVDTTTLKVEVFEGGIWIEYLKPDDFLVVTSTSKVYMLQEGFNGFEIYFGDGVLGYKPAQASPIRMTYMVTSGNVANGASIFTLINSHTSVFGGYTPVTPASITSTATSSGGLLEESVSSIKSNAKSLYGTQNRAVNSNDYATLALRQYPNLIKNIISWNGVDNVPPLFGKTVLCVQPNIGDVLLASDKAIISTFLETKNVGNVKVNFVDPEYVNVIINSTVKYDINQLSVGVYDLQFIVTNAITNYANANISQFNGILRSSTLGSVIDNSNYAVVSNETTISLLKSLNVNYYTSNSFLFSFSNQIKPSSLYSSNFYDGINNYPLYLKDDGRGKLSSYYLNNAVDVLYQSNVGTIDYVTGNVVISNLKISTLATTTLNIYVTSAALDVVSNKNIILSLKQANINVNVIKDVK